MSVCRVFVCYHLAFLSGSIYSRVHVVKWSLWGIFLVVEIGLRNPPNLSFFRVFSSGWVQRVLGASIMFLRGTFLHVKFFDKKIEVLVPKEDCGDLQLGIF